MQVPPAKGNTRRQRAGTTRRRNACIPCKESKIKCDGFRPCGACRTEKRKSRTCEYSEKPDKNAASLQEDDDNRDTRRSHSSTPDPLDPTFYGEVVALNHITGSVAQSVRVGSQFSSMYHRLALTHVIDEFLKTRPPKSSQAEHFGRVQNLTEGLRSHTRCLFGSNTPQFNLDSDDAGYEHHAFSHTANGVAAAWSGRLKTLEHWINNGELLRAWQDVASFQRAIQSHEMDTSDSLQAHPGFVKAATSTYTKLLELDCMLSFFLGEQSLFPFWKTLKYLSPRLEEIENEDPYFATKLELFEALDTVLQIDISNDAGVNELLQRFHKIQKARPPSRIEQIATCTPDKEPIKAQELKLFSNLFFMMLYCRTASVAEHYGQQINQIGRTAQPMDKDRPSVVEDLRLTGFRSRSAECKLAIKHAIHLLTAFKRLCEVDRKETAKCWFRLHGALIATVIVGVAGIRDRSKEHFTHTLPPVRDCFQNLRRLNSSCPIFERAEAYFAEFDRIRQQVLEKQRPNPTLDRRSSDPGLEGNVSVAAPHELSVRTGGDPPAPITGRKRSIGEVNARASLSKIKAPKHTGRLKTNQAESQDNIAVQEVNMTPNLPPPQTNLQHEDYTYADTMAVETYVSYPSSVNTSFAEVGMQPTYATTYPFHYPGPPAELPPEFAIHPPMNLDAEVYDPSRYYLDPNLQMNVLWHDNSMQNSGLMYASTPKPGHTPLQPHQQSPGHLPAANISTPFQILSSSPAQPCGSTSFFDVSVDNFEARRPADPRTINTMNNNLQPCSTQTHHDQMQEVAQTSYHFLPIQSSSIETGIPQTWPKPALSVQPPQLQGEQHFYPQNDSYSQGTMMPFHPPPPHESENEPYPSYAMGRHHHHYHNFRGVTMPS